MWAFLMLLSSISHQAFPDNRNSSPLDDLAWAATRVVLVVTTATDGTFEVLESWKGDLRVGERVIVPELRPASDAIPIARYPKSFLEAARGGVSELIPRQPVGAHMILFLRCSTGQREQTREMHGPAGCRWEPLDPMLTMKASAVWIDNGRLFRFTKFSVPGPTFLYEFPESQQTLQSRVAEIKAIQDEMATALAKHGAERAELLQPYVHSAVRSARQTALEELGSSGPLAAPTIRGMLDDPAFADEASELIGALVRADGENIGQDLTRRLQGELTFWRATGPSLAQGWWNEDPRRNAPLRQHYMQTFQLVLGIEKTHYSPALNTVLELRDFWRSLAQLNDPSGLNQMADECDKFIHHLQVN